MTAPQITSHEPRTTNRLVHFFQSEDLVLFLCALLFVLLAPFTPGLVSTDNFINLLGNLAPLLVVAVGLTVVLIAGGIDLSVTSTIALTSVVGGMVMNSESGWLRGQPMAGPVAALLMLLLGAVVGAGNGLAVTRLRMPAFMVTLTTMMFLSGLAIWLTKSKNIPGLPASFTMLGGRLWIALLIAASVAGVSHLMLSRSLLGRWLLAVGHNSRTAHISGVPVDRVVLSAYIVSGMCAAVASVLYTARIETASPVLGQRILLDVIGATVIGGTSLFGGRGKVQWTLFGALFLTLLDNALNLLGLSHFVIMMVKGVVILFAAFLDVARRSWSVVRGSLFSDEQPGRSQQQQTTSDEPQTTNNTLLSFDGIVKSFFGVRVLKNVRFGVGAGRIVGLVGENGAGKSTLMNVLGGNLAADEGTMRFAGKDYAPRSPREARAAGIGFVHQELNLFPNLTIAENLFLTDFPTTGPLIERASMHLRSTELLKRVGLSLAAETLVERLSAGERQLVEIARALSFDARLLILDEPTTSLSAREYERLFALIRQLRDEGRSFIFISHALGDVLRLCDELVILRDGEIAGQGAAGAFDQTRLVSLMVGRELKQLFPPRNASREEIHPSGEAPLLEVRHLSQPGVVRDISFTLHRNEVVGVAGLMGAGRTELARILFGIDPCGHGTITVAGEPLRGSPRRRIRRGLALLTESRREDGLCLEASVAENIALVTLPQRTRTPLRLIDAANLRGALGRIREAVRLQPGLNLEQPTRTLSGGNQQKVVLAKWLLAEPRVLILDEPTRGIDVGAKFEVYQLILERAERGAGVLLISSEIEELMGLCDRILVLSHGRITGEFPRSHFDREDILRAALAGHERGEGGS